MSALTAWQHDGSPYVLCQPGLDLRVMFLGYGYGIGSYPDDRHLAAVPPEDHTPFSATGYPGVSPYGVGMAIDVMGSTRTGMPSLAQLGAKILADKKAGVAGTQSIKYMNWTDGNNNCWNESWTPNYVRSSSTDRGHIHLSFRTDYAKSTNARGYSPVAALLPQPEVDMTPEEHADLKALAWRVKAILDNAEKVAGGPTVGEINQLHVALKANEPLPVTQEQLEQIKAAAGAGGAEMLDGVTVQSTIQKG